MPGFKRVKRNKQSFVFGASDTLQSAQSQMEGKIAQIHLRVPNFTADKTATLTIEDEDGYEIYNSGAKNRNTQTNLSVTQLIAGNFILKVTLSGAPGDPSPAVDWTVVAVLFYEGVY